MLFAHPFQLFSASFRYVSFSFSAFVARIVCASALFSCFFQSLTRFPALRYVSSPLLTIFSKPSASSRCSCNASSVVSDEFSSSSNALFVCCNLLLYSANLFPTFSYCSSEFFSPFLTVSSFFTCSSSVRDKISCFFFSVSSVFAFPTVCASASFISDFKAATLLLHADVAVLNSFSPSSVIYAPILFFAIFLTSL